MQHSEIVTAEALHAAYWRSQLDGLGDKSCFPVDVGSEAGTGAAFGTHELRLTPEMTARLDRVSRGQPETLHVVLAAALVALLGRYTGQDEVVVGQPTRSAGPDCPNTALVLRAAPRGTFRELLGKVGRAVREAVAHQDFPIALLADELGRRGDDGNPYFDVAIELDGLHDRGFARAGGTKLLVSAARDGDVLTLSLRYDAGRFAAASVARIGLHYALLLDRATAEPDRQVDDIDLFTVADREIIDASNATAREFDTSATIHGIFAAQAARTPNAPAVLTADRSVTYSELDARANQLAHTLRERGVRPDDLVAVVAERSVEMMVAILGILKAGAAYLPVDPSYPQARLDYVLTDSGARLAVAQGKFAALTGEMPTLDLDDAGTYARHTTAPEPVGGADNLAYVIYTSGSTGNPKGVQVEHRSVVNRTSWAQRTYPLGPGDVVLQKTSISFDLSVSELFWWAFAGAALALLEPGAEKDPALVASAVERHRVTAIHFVPSMLNLFLGHADRFGTASRMGGLRLILSNGEALTPQHVARCGDVLPGARLINMYGPTESTVDVTSQATEELRDPARVPIGRPMDNVRLYVLDGRGRPTPVGIPGELHIAGAGLARGYHNRDELTRERFVDGAGVGERRLYRTGDLARWLPDGALDYLGRIDLQVKVRGYRVEPGEIEERLRAHPAVTDAAVVPHEDGWQVSLRGFVALRGQVSEADLKQYLRETLPEYMVPGRILVLDALPLNPNGKLDRAALRRPDAAHRLARRHVEPRTEVERTLAGIWCEVLGLARVGVHDNFFAMGGNSIHFVTVLAKARAAGLTFTFQQLFKHQTIGGLAADMADVAAGAAVPHDVAARSAFQPFELLSAEDRAKIPPDVEDAYPLSLLQAGLIFQTEITGALGQYHDVLSYSIRGAFDPAAFEEAVRLLVARHPILRTTYHLTGFSQFVQMVHREVPTPCQVVDLRRLDEREQAQWHEDWLAKEKARRFRWQDGECVVTLFVQILTDDLYRYTLSQHNSALDGWSISLLHTQLFELYYQVRERRSADWPAVDNHVRNFIGLEVEAMRSTESREFWLRTLDGSTSTTLPRRPDADHTTDFRVVLHEVPLPDGLSDRVLALAEALSVPVKDVLLAAHVKVLSTVAGVREVMTGYEQSGRPELPGAETVLGLFLNTVPCRVNLVDGTWRDLIRQVYQTELDLLPHRRYPMARMKQDLSTQRMLFDTTFNFTHFYLLKNLRKLPEFSLLGMRVDSETEFVFRTEFSRHFFDDNIELLLHYHTHLFDPDQIDRIAGYFVRVLELMTSEPDAPHTARPLAGDAELALLREFGHGQSARQLLHDRYASSAVPGPDPGVQVLDAAGQPVPLGTAGEIVVGGRRTGDRGRWLPDGRLEPLAAEEGSTGVTPAASKTAAVEPVAATASRPTMDRIAAVWSRVLGVPVGELGPAADFFAVGGDSLSALRVVLELDGLVTLTDLTVRPRLDRLAELVDERQQPDEELLHLLSTNASNARCGLVCVPYPAGHPINFKPLAETLEKVSDEIAVYGLEQPGHDPTNPGRFVDVEQTARLVVAEIERKADLPLILWGHCGGAPITMAVARLLEEQGFDLRHVFLGAKLLPTVDEMRQNIEIINGWTDEDIIRYMVDETGYTDLDDLTRAHAELVGRIFRHDVCDGYRYLIEVSEHPGQPVDATVTVVIAEDDPVLAGDEDQYRNWSRLATDVRLHQLSDGGHYFVRTNPTATGELVERTWSATAGGEG